MPRPRELENPRIVPVYLEYEQYLLLNEIALRKEISLSKLLREVIDEYLEKRGLKEQKAVAHDCGISIMKTIEYTILTTELSEYIPYLKREIEILKSTIPKSRRWIGAKNRAMKLIKKIYAIIQKLGVVNNKNVREAIKLIHEFKKCVEGDVE